MMMKKKGDNLTRKFKYPKCELGLN